MLWAPRFDIVKVRRTPNGRIVARATGGVNRKCSTCYIFFLLVLCWWCSMVLVETERSAQGWNAVTAPALVWGFAFPPASASGESDANHRSPLETGG